MTTHKAHPQTRILVQTAAKVCEDKKGQDTRILALDLIDSGLADFFLITSATSDRQAISIADEIELRLKRDFGVHPHSVEGRRQGEWILLDYIDFVIHIFLVERRAFYDIERLRKSARPLTPAEFDAELTAALAAKTRAARGEAEKIPAAAPKRSTPAEPATRRTASRPGAKGAQKKSAAKKPTPKPAAKKSAKESSPKAKPSPRTTGRK